MILPLLRQNTIKDGIHLETKGSLKIENCVHAGLSVTHNTSIDESSVTRNSAIG